MKWLWGRSYIDFSNVFFCGEKKRIRFCVVCCMGVPVRFFSSNICNIFIHIYSYFYSNIPLPYLWYVWVENIKNQSWSVTRILEQCRIWFMWFQLCCVYLLNCTQPAMVTVEIDLSHGHVIEECHIMPRTLCSRACLKPCHVPFPCNVLTPANMLIYSKSIFFFTGEDSSRLYVINSSRQNQDATTLPSTFHHFFGTKDKDHQIMKFGSAFMTHACFCEAKGVSTSKHMWLSYWSQSPWNCFIFPELLFWFFFLPCRSGSVSNKDVNSKTWNQSTGIAYLDLFSILGGWSISDFLCLDVWSQIRPKMII